jgi:hypothetical protein
MIPNAEFDLRMHAMKQSRFLCAPAKAAGGAVFVLLDKVHLSFRSYIRAKTMSENCTYTNISKESTHKRNVGEKEQHKANQKTRRRRNSTTGKKKS